MNRGIVGVVFVVALFAIFILAIWHEYYLPKAKKAIKSLPTINVAISNSKEVDSLKSRCAFLQDAVNGSLVRRDFLDSFYWRGSKEIDSLRKVISSGRYKRSPIVNTVNQTGGQAGFIINN